MIKYTPTVAEISLAACVYTKSEKQLTLESHLVGGRFPDVIKVRSHRTGAIIEFVKINENHRLFCEDSWDGEQSVYEPKSPVKNVESLVVFHGEH